MISITTTGADGQGANFILVTIFLNTVTIIKSTGIKVATNHSEAQSGIIIMCDRRQHSRSII